MNNKNVFEVESILDRKKENGKVKYLVKWANSWESERNISPASIAEYCEREQSGLKRKADETVESVPKRCKKDENTLDIADDISKIKSSIMNIENLLKSGVKAGPPPPPPPPAAPIGLIEPKKLLKSLQNPQQESLINELNNMFR